MYRQSQDKKTLKKINALLKDIVRHPFECEGKPEKLRGPDGVRSRRITEKDRLAYVAVDDDILVARCRGRYDDK